MAGTIACLRTALAVALIVGAALVTTALAAQETNFFRIGTGGTSGTYFPIGGLVANAISAPPGSRVCAEGGACGVPGLVAIAVASTGSISNVEDITAGRLEAGFTQSDVAYWAYTGTGVFDKRPPAADLRAIANLYPETVQVVVRKGSGMNSIADLRGKRVSLDEPGSGTLADARIVLEAFGIRPGDLDAEYLKPDVAGQKLAAGEIDAFFFVGGAPVEAITMLSQAIGIDFLPITGSEVERTLTRYSFFSFDHIARGTYRGVGEIPTISVNGLLVTSATQNDDLIYGITRALWSDSTRTLLERGHPKGRVMRKNSAARGLGIPLHPGAERFYREQGILPKR